MRATPYELSFEVAELPEAVEDAICDAFDAVVATHSGVTTVTFEATGDTCVEAAITASHKFRDLGASPIRLVDDVVTRTEIARRAGVTPQAVGQWIRGERHADSQFPAPFILTGGGLWLWGEVVEALAERGLILNEGVRYPTRRDSQLIGGTLAKRMSKPGDVLIFATFDGLTTRGPARVQVPVNTNRTSFALIA